MRILFYLVLFCLGSAGTSYAQSANVQVIHNSAEQSVTYLDVYFDNQKVVDSLAFREATPYLPYPAGSNVVVTLQDPSINDTSEAVYKESFNLEADSSYVMITTGIIPQGLYDSLEPFDLAIHRSRIESQQPGNVDVLFYHGVTDAGEFSLHETTTTIPNLVDSVGYDEFSGFHELPVGDMEMELINERTADLLALYSAPFNNWGLQDSAIVILASGFYDTVKTNPGDTVFTEVPQVGLYVATPGGGPLVPLPAISDIGLDDVEVLEARIYPNPAYDFIRIRMDQAHQKLTTRIVNINGELVQQSETNNHGKNILEVDISHLSPGPYIVMCAAESGVTYVQEVVIRR